MTRSEGEKIAILSIARLGTDSDLQCYLIHGVLLDCPETYRERQKAREGFDYFMTLLESPLRCCTFVYWILRLNNCHVLTK